MDIVTATSLYESWLREQTTVVQADLDAKHANMSANLFVFMRATFYRWARRFPVTCGDLLDAPQVNCVRDLHIENFGTWRDSEGRLVWGINDFDEAFPGAYTEDLARLVTSVAVADSCGLISFKLKDACDAVLAGYEKGLRKGPSPFVLSHRHNKLRRMAESKLRDPRVFWAKMQSLPQARPVNPSALKVLTSALPQGVPVRFKTRRAGAGSLGRQRFVAIADIAGGYIAREVKAMIPSAVTFTQQMHDAPLFFEQTIAEAARSLDPFLALRDGWILRRLSPHCSRIELGQLKAASDGFVLLKAMGRETANIHAADPNVAATVLDDLQRRPKDWLRKASEHMHAEILDDWKHWRKAYRKAA